MPTRLQIAKPDIIKHFNSIGKKVLDRTEISSILNTNYRFWRLAQSTTLDDFLKFMLEKTNLKRIQLDFPQRKIVRYCWSKISFYELLMSLQKNCYLTHFTAMYLHELTDQIPKTFYVNYEQKPKFKNRKELNQEGIKLAFKKPTRLSKNTVQYKNYNITLLNGMHTDNAGITEILGPSNENVRVTSVERTLIDIVVRPEYSGGIFQVLNAFKEARKKVSINKLSVLLKKLDYVYPYHQAIGFYMERSGVYSKTQIDLLRKFKFEYDFYLAHKIDNALYSTKWKLFYPKSLEKTAS